MREMIGILVLLGLTFLLSTNRKKISWGQVLWGLALQALLALTILNPDIWGRIGLLIFVYFIFSYNVHRIRSHDISSSTSLLYELGVSLCFTAIILLLGFLEQQMKIVHYVYIFFIAFILIYWVAKAFRIPWIRDRKWANILGIIYVLLAGGLILGQQITGAEVVQKISKGITIFLSSNKAGGQFVFGKLMTDSFVFALSIISSTVFFASVMSILEYLGATSILVNAMARFIAWNMRFFKVKPLSGVEALISTANIFLSMQASPFLVKKYLPTITRSEVATIIVVGLATIAGGTMAIFINAGIPAEYLLAASVMSTPAAICLAKILCPETEHPFTLNKDMVSEVQNKSPNILGAASEGIMTGMRSGALISVMIMGFVSLIALMNLGFSLLDQYIDGQFLPTLLHRQPIFKSGKGFVGIIPSSLDQLFSYLGTPMAWLLGVPYQDIFYVGELLGLKIAVNEAVAYTKMLEFIQDGHLSPRSIAIASYALCGFANFGSLGILIGVMSSIVPERKNDFITLGVRGVFVSAFASFMTAAFASLFFIN